VNPIVSFAICWFEAKRPQANCLRHAQAGLWFRSHDRVPGITQVPKRHKISDREKLGSKQLLETGFVGQDEGGTVNLNEALALEIREQASHGLAGGANDLSNFLMGEGQ